MPSNWPMVSSVSSFFPECRRPERNPPHTETHKLIAIFVFCRSTTMSDRGSHVLIAGICGGLFVRHIPNLPDSPFNAASNAGFSTILTRALPDDDLQCRLQVGEADLPKAAQPTCLKGLLVKWMHLVCVSRSSLGAFPRYPRASPMFWSVFRVRGHERSTVLEHGRVVLVVVAKTMRWIPRMRSQRRKKWHGASWRNEFVSIFPEVNPATGVVKVGVRLLL